MSALIVPPPRQSPVNAQPPRPKRFTVAEFHRLVSLGLLTGRRPFLLDGVIWEQEPMNPPHADGIILVTEVLRAVFGLGWVVRAQLPLQLDEFNDPVPDFAVVRGGLRDHLGQHPTIAELVVEVADTTFDFDTTEKAERYAAAKILDYWVLDLTGRRLLVLRDPAPLPSGLGATAYQTQFTLGPADTVAPHAAPTTTVRIGDMLP
jgi:Uma2 family endonuclease